MGVNMAGNCIVGRRGRAARPSLQEIVRRYYQAACRDRRGQELAEHGERLKHRAADAPRGIGRMRRAGRAAPAMAVADGTASPPLRWSCPTGTIVTGTDPSLLGACSSACCLNALKNARRHRPDEV